MMTDLINTLETPMGMVLYFLGVGSSCGWYYVKNQWLGKKREPVNWTTLGILVGISCLILVGMQNTQLAAEVKGCQHEFNTAIVSRNDIRETNDRLSQEQRFWLSKNDEAISDLVRFLFAPPDPNIAAMDNSDPRRRAWQLGLVDQYNLRTSRYRAQIDRITTQQDANKREWDDHPLPDPECGK